MNAALRDWLCRQLRPLVDVRFCAPTQPALMQGQSGAPALRIGLWTGVFIHVHYLDRAPNLRQLRRILQHDEEVSCVSLFLLDAALAPKPDERLAPPDWMLALHSLGHERLYVGAAPGRKPGLFPVHLLQLQGTKRFRALYGPALQPQRLHTGRVNIRRRNVRGFWNIAHFGAAAFWQREAGETFANARRFGAGSSANGSIGDTSPAESKLFRSYALLGLQPDAAREQAREAFRRQALDLHPDVSALPTGIAEERFRAIAEAWETIRVARGWN